MRRFPVPVGLLSSALIALVALVLVPAAGAWTWPSDGAVLQPFSFDPAHPYAAGQHRGIDVGGAGGAPVVTPAAGTVTFAGAVPGSGKTVTVTTPDGLAITLTHLGSLIVAEGAAVTEGDGVGTIGPSGEPEVQEPYVHLGIRLAANPQGYLDPLSLLPARPAPVTAPSAPTPPPQPVAPQPLAVVSTPVSVPLATAPAAPAVAPAVPVLTEAATAGPVAAPDRATTPRGGDSPVASFLTVRHRPRVRTHDSSSSGPSPRPAESSAPSRAGSSRAASALPERHIAAAAAAARAESGTRQTRQSSEARPHATPRQRAGASAGGGEARTRSHGASHPRALRARVPVPVPATAPARTVRGGASVPVRWSTVAPLLALLLGLIAAAGSAARLRADRERVRMMAGSGNGSEDPGSARLAVCSGAS